MGASSVNSEAHFCADCASAPCGLAEDAATLLDRAAQIIIGEFSFDGEDPNGCKAYQDDVNRFKEMAKQLRG